jgi:hypothetical protein
MKYIIIGFVLLISVSALAGEPSPPQQQPSYGEKVLQRLSARLAASVTAQVMDEQTIEDLTAQIVELKQNAAYWRDACQSTPECGGRKGN